jgi:hypothetical protein
MSRSSCFHDGIFPSHAGNAGLQHRQSCSTRSKSDSRAARRFVKAHNNSADNTYIQRASFNGAPLDRPWFTHADVVSGGTLELTMGDRPTENGDAAPRRAALPWKRVGCLCQRTLTRADLKECPIANKEHQYPSEMRSPMV